MKNKTNIQVLLALCAALLAVGGFVFSTYYIGGLTEKTSLLKEEIETKEIKIKRIQYLNKSAEKTNEDRTKLLDYFIKSDGAVDFVSSLEEVASSFNLVYSTNSIENTEIETLSAQDKQLLRVSMTLSGGWRNVVGYLLYIESLPYALNIEKLELVSEGVSPVFSSVSAPVSQTNQTAQPESTATTKAVSESKWKLGITFSVVKIKDKK